jgi:hypothetical protein
MLRLRRNSSRMFGWTAKFTFCGETPVGCAKLDPRAAETLGCGAPRISRERRLMADAPRSGGRRAPPRLIASCLPCHCTTLRRYQLNPRLRWWPGLRSMVRTRYSSGRSACDTQSAAPGRAFRPLPPGAPAGGRHCSCRSKISKLERWLFHIHLPRRHGAQSNPA